MIQTSCTGPEYDGPLGVYVYDNDYYSRAEIKLELLRTTLDHLYSGWFIYTPTDGY